MMLSRGRLYCSLAIILAGVLMLNLCGCQSNANKGSKQEDAWRNKYGYIDRNGNIVIEPQFNDTYGFTEGLAVVLIDKKWGYIDWDGNIVIEPQFDDAYGFFDGMAAIRIDDKWGFIDKSGDIVIAPQFGDVGMFKEGLAYAKPPEPERKYGYINTTGKFVIEPKFGRAGEFSEGLALARDEDTEEGISGYIDKTGNYVIQPTDPNKYGVGAFHENRAKILNGGSYGYIDRTGEVVIEPKFMEAHDFQGGLASVRVGDKWGYIDVFGNVVVEPKYGYAFRFDEGLSSVSNEDLKGSCLIDHEGIEVFSTENEVGYFSEGMANIKNDGKYGYIDREFNVVIEPKYKNAYSFHEGLAAVQF